MKLLGRKPSGEEMKVKGREIRNGEEGWAKLERGKKGGWGRK